MHSMEVRGELPGEIDFVAVGHLAVDYRDGERVLGGSAAYACLTASRLGLATAMVTAVGEDFDLFAPLAGIEIHYHQAPGASTSFRNSYQGHDRHQRLLGRARSLGEEDLAFRRSRLAERAAVLYCPIARELDGRLVALAPGGRCGVAPQGFFRQWDEEGKVSKTDWIGAAQALAEADFVSMSEDDPPRPRKLAQQLAVDSRIVAVTEGDAGARLYLNGRCYQVPAFPRSELEPTGAGDVFAAAFLVALREDRAPLDAAEFACCAASFAVERVGVEGVPANREAVDERLTEYRNRFRPREVAP
jgi:sugar/nucleoside kinase (ribokinase family)